jgi:uncharacterized protein with PQ loop repeat
MTIRAAESMLVQLKMLEDTNMELTIVAGSISSTIFAFSILPMLAKAYISKDLSSYSFWYIGLNNVGNVIHSFYVFSLPFGPIWFLHGFYLLSAALMMIWYLRYGRSSINRNSFKVW